MSDTEPILYHPPREWFHGSPLRLEYVLAGSTVTPIIELAKAFSHKPSRVEFVIEEHDGERFTRITHTGTRDGFLYRVIVNDPLADLRQHPTSVCAPGEEMLAIRDLPLEFICELPMAEEPGEYRVKELSE